MTFKYWQLTLKKKKIKTEGKNESWFAERTFVIFAQDEHKTAGKSHRISETFLISVSFCKASSLRIWEGNTQTLEPLLCAWYL